MAPEISDRKNIPNVLVVVHETVTVIVPDPTTLNVWHSSVLTLALEIPFTTVDQVLPELSEHEMLSALDPIAPLNTSWFPDATLFIVRLWERLLTVLFCDTVWMNSMPELAAAFFFGKMMICGHARVAARITHKKDEMKRIISSLNPPPRGR